MAVEIWRDFYDVLILPPEQIRRQAIALSDQLHRHGSRWKLGVEEFIPHLSLYHLPVRPENFGEFTGALNDAVCGFRGGEFQLTAILEIRGRAVFLVTDRPRWLSNLYKRVIETTRSFFDEARREEIRTRWGKMTTGMHKSFEWCGAPMTGINFVPHFTLGVFDREEDRRAGLRELGAELTPFPPRIHYHGLSTFAYRPLVEPVDAGELEFKPATFRVDRLHVGQVGTGFSCQGVIHETVF